MTATPAPEWLVIAAICDCNKVAITVMNNHDPANTEAGEDEVTATGPNWQALVPVVAHDLMNRTGLTLSGMCTVGSTKDPDARAALTTEAVNLVYALADSTLTATRNANPEAPKVRVSHQAGGWTLPSLSPDVQACTSNYTSEREGMLPCTAAAVWKVSELYDDLHATFGFWCDDDLPAEHRHAAAAALLGHVPASASTPVYAVTQK